MAAVNAAAGNAAPQQPVIPYNYRDFYNDAANDPFQGEYTVVILEFGLEPHNMTHVAPATLLTQLSGQVMQGSCNLVLVHVGNTANADDAGLIELYHNVAQYSRGLGMPTTQWDSRCFATKGDIVPPMNHYLTTEFDCQLFYQVASQVRRPTLDVAANAFIVDPALQLLGPYNNGDAGTTVLKVRRSQILPPRYGHYFLDGGKTPRQCLTEFWAMVMGDGLDVQLAPLLDFFLVAATRHGAAGPVTRTAALPAVQADSLMMHHRHDIVTRHLPLLGQQVATQGAQAIANSVHGLTAAHHATAQAESARRAATAKSPDSMLGQTILSLLALAHVGTSAQLPPVWQDLAQAPKGGQRAAIQARINDEAMTISPQVPIKMPPSIVAHTIGLEWATAHPSDLSTGIHPFLFGTGHPTEGNGRGDQATAFDFMMTGGTAPSHQDVMQFVIASDKDLYFPRNTMLGRMQLISWWGWLRTHLGWNHVWAAAVEKFLTMYQQQEFLLDTIPLNDESTRPLVPALVNRWVQLRFNTWVRQQMQSALIIEAPDLCILFDRMHNGEAWEPTLPAAYVRQIAPTPSPAPQLLPGPPALPGQVGGVGPPVGPPAGVQSYVRNETPDVTFQVYRDRGLTARDVRSRATTPPPICPGFHVKGGCNTNCRNASTHRPLIAAEQASLIEWCEEFWVAAG